MIKPLSPSILPFGKAQRLRTPSEYRRVYQSKQFGGSDLHTFNVIANNAQVARLGVTVSKKVSKLAIVRNRLKRQIKEFYRAHQHELLAADLVITAKPKCALVATPEQLVSLEQLWKKVMKWQRWYLATHPVVSNEGSRCSHKIT